MAEELKEEAPKEDRRNQLMVNDQGRCFQIILFDQGEDSLSKAIGALEMAKDMVKAKFTEWRTIDAKKQGILVPNGSQKSVWKPKWMR